MVDTPNEEPCLARRYVGEEKYKWFIVGKKTRNPLVNTPFDTETEADRIFKPMKDKWEKAHPPPPATPP